MTGTPTAVDEQIGTGDGANCDYALVKHYSTGESRRITRPVTGSVRVAVNGIEVSTGWTLEDAGIIRFASPPAAEVAI